MQNTFVFFDVNEGLVSEYRRVLKEQGTVPGSEQMILKFERMDCRKLVREYDIDVLVSPANSMGYMDGGIDLYYSRMFPGIQRRVQRAIRKYGLRDGAHYVLPVGSAILVPATEGAGSLQVMCAPTMQRPENIEHHPDNVRRCFYAMLKCLQGKRWLEVGVPGMGTGCGGLTPEQSAQQIRLAIEDFASGNADAGNLVLFERPGEYVIRENQ